MDELVTPRIPDLDGVVSTSRGDGAAVGKVKHLVDYVGVIVKGVQFSVCSHVPNFDQLVIAAGDGVGSSGVKIGRAHPVSVANKGADEFTRGKGPNLGCLIVRACNEMLGVGGEFNGTNSTCMSLECHCLTLTASGIKLKCVREIFGHIARAITLKKVDLR